MHCSLVLCVWHLWLGLGSWISVHEIYSNNGNTKRQFCTQMGMRIWYSQWTKTATMLFTRVFMHICLWICLCLSFISPHVTNSVWLPVCKVKRITTAACQCGVRQWMKTFSLSYILRLTAVLLSCSFSLLSSCKFLKTWGTSSINIKRVCHGPQLEELTRY